MRRIVIAAIILAGIATNASAAWFARVDSGGKLVITGVAVNPDETNTAVYLTCRGETFDIEVLTVFNAKSYELSYFKGTKVILGYKTKTGDEKKMGLDGEPVVSAGGALSIRATLTGEQSSAINDSIGRGYRLDVELVHPELTDDTGVKKVLTEGFATMTLAIAAECPAIK
ncbi:hypothetical protein Rleg10DRAFT_5602 [Rhizobium leguminosarum bv. trifolii WSM2012]|nr:hypothetical protein Rleg10DRAFT_4383 [Rhizobium leguminosarum bv. trifolii WSM2012]EJC76912.1 hypothetical protein Rleg10DRAFT_5602 [Rhizobium leguminosarum bv. trifolii WSM2012]